MYFFALGARMSISYSYIPAFTVTRDVNIHVHTLLPYFLCGIKGFTNICL